MLIYELLCVLPLLHLLLGVQFTGDKKIGPESDVVPHLVALGSYLVISHVVAVFEMGL